MTTPPFLPATDLARFAPLPTDRKWRELEGFKMGFPPYSYDHVRASFGDLLSLETPLFGSLGPVPYEHIATAIASRCTRGEKEIEANLRVAAGLYELRWSGRKQPFTAMPMTIGQKLTYCTPAVLAVEGRPVVAFFNPRRNALRPDSRRFVFSMMHEQIRVADPDYAGVGLCICHFTAPKSGPRRARPVFDTGVALYSFDELQAMVAETYAIWAEVWSGRVEETRRRGSGGLGGGFDF